MVNSTNNISDSGVIYRGPPNIVNNLNISTSPPDVTGTTAGSPLSDGGGPPHHPPPSIPTPSSSSSSSESYGRMIMSSHQHPLPIRSTPSFLPPTSSYLPQSSLPATLLSSHRIPPLTTGLSDSEWVIDFFSADEVSGWCIFLALLTPKFLPKLY